MKTERINELWELISTGRETATMNYDEFSELVYEIECEIDCREQEKVLNYYDKYAIETMRQICNLHTHNHELLQRIQYLINHIRP